MCPHYFFVAHRLVIEARYVDLVRQVIVNCLLPIIEGRGRGPTRISFVEEPYKPFRFLPPVGGVLFWNFIANTPQDDARVIAVAAHHVTNVAFGPLIVILAVAI